MKAALIWLLTGEVGASSQCILRTWLQLPNEAWHYPCDPDDFNRCLKLLSCLPEAKDAFATLSEQHAVWRALIENWDEIEDSFLREAGFDWSKQDSAPKTHRIMRAFIDAANKKITQSREDAKEEETNGTSHR